MEEKVLYELKLIETEDGFRMEVKGDKETLRRRGFGLGPLLRATQSGKGSRRHRHPRGFGRRHWGRRYRMGGSPFRAHGHGPRHAEPDVKWVPDQPAKA